LTVMKAISTGMEGDFWPGLDGAAITIQNVAQLYREPAR